MKNKSLRKIQKAARIGIIALNIFTCSIPLISHTQETKQVKQMKAVDYENKADALKIIDKKAAAKLYKKAAMEYEKDFDFTLDSASCYKKAADLTDDKEEKKDLLRNSIFLYEKVIIIFEKLLGTEGIVENIEVMRDEAKKELEKLNDKEEPAK
ncbi:hypothetical protein KAW38_00245 [Candidatus Micrarchaeota archaeon]|nr:hypothetical protein [Candidatus Micrarchaeota archaeon]